MIVYASPKSGKSSYCKTHDDWIDADIILFKLLNKAFKTSLTDSDDKGQQIIKLFKRDRNKAEEVYTDFMLWLKENKESNNILLGTRRFMWLADKIYLKNSIDDNLFFKEIDSAKKWELDYIVLKKTDFINEKLLS